MAEGGLSSNDIELRDDTAGVSLVDFCVQLDDCAPTVRSGTHCQL